MSTENDALSRGFDAGNCAAYGDPSGYGFSQYMEKGLRSHRSDESFMAHPRAYKAAYLLGFYSSFETREIPREVRAKVLSAHRRYAKKMRALGINVPRRAMKRR